MSDSEDNSPVVWIIEEGSKVFKGPFTDELLEAGNRVATVLLLGGVVEEFARRNFNFNEDEEKNKVENLKAAYTDFFTNPSQTRQFVSSEIKTKIEKVPNIENITEAVDRFSKIYFAYCKIVDVPELEDYLEEGNTAALQAFVRCIPDMNNKMDNKMDRKLHKIFCYYLKSGKLPK